MIVDEAHSSQSGESAMELKGVLNADRLQQEAAEYLVNQQLDGDEDTDHLAGVVREMMKRAKQPNLSFFAFTATPKFKTLKVFDEPGPNGQAPFHLYTMRQAIEEKFILDVLKSYVTYEAYFRLVQVGDDDPHVQRKKAARALARTLTFHAVNLRTKTEVMVEHFRTHVKHKIGGRAKAMVVTDGRLHAVRYKQAFDNYIAEKGYTDVKTLVAFSGIVEDPDAPGKTFTEVGMNGGIKESELPERFDSHEYQGPPRRTLAGVDGSDLRALTLVQFSRGSSRPRRRGLLSAKRLYNAVPSVIMVSGICDHELPTTPATRRTTPRTPE